MKTSFSASQRSIKQEMAEVLPVENSSDDAAAAAAAKTRLPRVTIQFCTQCKWMLRAAYFAQELLSTFSTSLGEVALQPATGGVFIVEITTSAGGDDENTVSKNVLWDRKTDGGFPETKELKRRVRDVIDPGRGLGHVDRDYSKKKPEQEEGEKAGEAKEAVEAGKACKVEDKEKCEDCQ